MRKFRFSEFRNVSIIGLFHYCLLSLCVSVVSLTVTGCGSKPNQTLLNRPNTVITESIDDLRHHSIDPQIAEIGVTRPVRAIEYSVYGLEGAVLRMSTSDVMKPLTANWLADYGLPTGQWRKMEFDRAYACFSKPLNIKGNVIRYRVRGGRDGGVAGEHQLTLTVNNHDTLQEAKRVFIEKVEVLCKHIHWDSEARMSPTSVEPVIRHRILNEHFVDPSDDQTVPGQFRAADQWQPAPDPSFKYHSFKTHYWRLPFDYDGGMHSADLSIYREPLSENGYRWGDPFVIRVMFAPHGP